MGCGASTALVLLPEAVKFTRAHGDLILSDGDMVATDHSSFDAPRAMICGNYIVYSGLHCAEFVLTSYGCVGVASPGFDVARFDMLSKRSHRAPAAASASVSSSGWAFNLKDGALSSEGGSNHGCFRMLDGLESWQAGQTIGLQLDLTAGTLEVFLDGRRLGAMARGLTGPLCWYAECHTAGGAVRVRGKHHSTPWLACSE